MVYGFWGNWRFISRVAIIVLYWPEFIAAGSPDPTTGTRKPQTLNLKKGTHYGFVEKFL